jgi:hypothetical protein
MDAKNGGPAFPQICADALDVGMVHEGASLRDYFAAKAVQPGVQELATAAGLHCPDGISIWSDGKTRVGNFNEWWRGLSNEERFALVAKVKFQEADAMITARETK